MTTKSKSIYLGLNFDDLTLKQASDRVHALATRSPPSSVITPNVDHMVRLDRSNDSSLAHAYQTANLCLCDSRVLAGLARLQGTHLPVVPGSDLTAAVFASMPAESNVAIIGGDETSLAALRMRFPQAIFTQFRPPMGLLTNAVAMNATLDWVRNSNAHYIFLAVGSPQSELLADRIKQSRSRSGVILCIGASIDFITGRQRRAPKMIQRLALEWLWRLGTNPRRLARRYLVEGPRIFGIALRGHLRWN